jgi:hypothetical protein
LVAHKPRGCAEGGDVAEAGENEWLEDALCMEGSDGGVGTEVRVRVMV